MILDGVLLSDCYWCSEVTEEYDVILVGEETGVRSLTRRLINDGKIPAIMHVRQASDSINTSVLFFGVCKK